MRSGALDVTIKNDGKHGVTDEIRTMLREYPAALYSSPRMNASGPRRIISYRGNKANSFAYAFNGLLNILNDIPAETLMSGQYVITTSPWAGIKIPGGTNMKVRASFYLGAINDCPALISEDFDFVKIPVGKGNPFAEDLLEAPLFYRAWLSAALDGLDRDVSSTYLIKYAQKLEHFTVDVSQKYQMDRSIAVSSGWARLNSGKLVAKKNFSWEADMLSSFKAA